MTLDNNKLLNFENKMMKNSILEKFEPLDIDDKLNKLVHSLNDYSKYFKGSIKSEDILEEIKINMEKGEYIKSIDKISYLFDILNNEIEANAKKNVQTSFVRANLKGANMSNVDIRGTDLREANLIGTKLIGAKLDRANLTGAMR